jgi:hypothetical protein
MPSSKIVYIGMPTDLIHHGHLNIISEGRKHRKVIIGLSPPYCFFQLIILSSFTITHILIAIGFPAILLMPIINNTWKYFPPNIILYLTHLLGLLFIIIAFKKRIEN